MRLLHVINCLTIKKGVTGMTNSISKIGQFCIATLAALLFLVAAGSSADASIFKSRKHQPKAPAVKTETSTDWGLQTTSTETPRGKVTVNLPGDVAAGDTIYGTVVVEPAGKTEAERQGNTDELNGYVVEVEGAKASVGDNVLNWSVPAVVAGGLTELIFSDSKGKEVSRTSIPVKGAPPQSATSVPPQSSDFGLPSIGQAGKPGTITGRFSGTGKTTTVRIGGKEAKILAESPRQAVYENPKETLGQTHLELEEGATKVSSDYRVVAVSLSSPKTSILKGETTKVSVVASGLESLDKEIMVQLDSPSANISMEGGNFQLITIRPRDISAGGVFSNVLTVTGLQAGSFMIHARLRLFPGPSKCGEVFDITGRGTDDLLRDEAERLAHGNAAANAGESCPKICPPVLVSHGPVNCGQVPSGTYKGWWTCTVTDTFKCTEKK